MEIMGQQETIMILNSIKNSQVISLKYGTNMGNQQLIWAYFNVNDPHLHKRVSDFIFYNDTGHKKIIMGKYDYNTKSIPISYIY